MTELLSSLGLPQDIGLVITIYLIVVVAAIWLGMVVWAYRDMRARSRDRLAQLGVGVMVALLTLPGLIIYLLMRPRETLTESYERSLEEEALLQEIEEKPTCPGCGQRVRETWQACPHCNTRLKRVCTHCRQLLELSWQICPYCTVPQPGANTADDAGSERRHARPSNVPESTSSIYAPRTPPRSSSSSQPAEFVEGD
jgi:RNA polymerase subunit RPABC4/transcription elongation factor Spt4